MRGAQLPLAVHLRDTASFDSYFPGPNAEALAAVRDPGERLYLYGPDGCGRTHLLQALCRERQGSYLPLADLRDYGPEVLEGSGDAALLCLDDLDAVIGDRAWALALLRLLDARRSQRAPVTVIAAGAPPDRLALDLPDLRTRLAACAVHGLRPLDDGERRELLRLRAAARGLALPDEVGRWLLHTQARGTGELLDALDRLDRAALTAKRRLTLPLAQAVLAPAGERTGPG